jgi:hypothetical protein
MPTMLCLLWLIGRSLFDSGRTFRRIPVDQEESMGIARGDTIAATTAILDSGLYSWNLNGSTVLALFLGVQGCGYVIVMRNERSVSFSTIR